MAKFRNQSFLGGRFGLFATVAAVFLAACGGGGGGDDFGPVLPGKLVYVDVVSGQDQLWVSRGDGSESRQIVIGPITVLPPHDAGESNLQASQITSIGLPVWSPDGSQIAVTVSRAENQSQIIVVDAETSAAFTASPQLGEVIQRELTANDYYRMKYLDWSPDGRYLAYLLRDSDSAPRRLTMTHLNTGEVEELLAESAELEMLAHRWDENSDGLYIGAIFPDRDDVIHLDLATRSQTTTGIRGPIGNDLTRSGGELFSIFDFEFTALGFTEYRGQPGTSVVINAGPDRGEFFGWFLSSPILLAVEQIRGGVDRKPPLIARFNPTSPVNIGSRFDYFSVRAPVAFKWDFLADL